MVKGLMEGVTEWKESIASVYAAREFARICFSLQWCSHTLLGQKPEPAHTGALLSASRRAHAKDYVHCLVQDSMEGWHGPGLEAQGPSGLQLRSQSSLICSLRPASRSGPVSSSYVHIPERA